MKFANGTLKVKYPSTYVSGRKYRVKVLMGIIGSQYPVYSNIATATPAPTPTLTQTTSPIVWTEQPSNQSYVSGSDITFSFAYNYSANIPASTSWQYSDDGTTWLDDPPVESINSASSFVGNVKFADGTLKVKDPSTYVSGRRYRVKVLMGIIGSQYPVYSNIATVI